MTVLLPQSLFRLCLAALGCLGLPLANAAAPVTIDNPSKYELVYFGLQQHNPPVSKVKAHDKYFWVYDGVVAPTIHSLLFLQHIKINSGEEMLDIGTGSGIQSVFAADKARRIVATDIDPKSVENARYNIDRHGLDHIVSVRQGDMFAPIKQDEQFDVILFNVIYPFNNQSQHLWTLHERFFSEVKNYLKPNGRIYYQSGYIDNISRIKAIVEQNGLQIIEMNMVAMLKDAKEPIVFRIERRVGS